MTLAEFLNLHAKKMGYLETIFLRDVYYRDYGERGLDFIVPEVHIDRNDGSGREWRIDFVVTTAMRKYAIECDGYNYHAAGAISRERFNELEAKRNETVNQGYLPVSLSRDQITEDPQEAVYQLRRMFNADPELYNIFLNRVNGQVEPHQIQQLALDALLQTRADGNIKGLVVLATGLGKTYLSAFDAKALPASSVLFIVHVEHILKQARNSFEDVLPQFSQDIEFFTGREKEVEKKKIVFATIQTLTKEKNLKQFSPEQFDYVVMDETHHAAAPTYIKVTDYFKPRFFLGLTATPERMDGQEILPYYDNNLVFEMDQAEAIKRGYLASLEYKGFKDNVDYSNIYFNGFHYDIDDLNKTLMIERRDRAVISKFQELAAKKKTIGFCVSIEHAEWSAKRFREAGIDAVAIHSQIKGRVGQEYQTAEEVLDAFDKGKHQVAFVVDMLNEGIDIPDVECLLMLRPTESVAILTQQIGRGLRIAPGKDNLIILDFIGNYKTAPRILDALGIKGTRELREDQEKQMYFYENEGRSVEFETEVVDIFRSMVSKTNKAVNESLISQDWREYGDYLADNTQIGNNFFWSVGKKNNDIDIQLWALSFIKGYAGFFKTSEELSAAIKTESQRIYGDKSLEGTRGLFFSKLIGLLKSTNPLSFSQAYDKLALTADHEKILSTVSDQLEKFYFWNSTFSLINRHAAAKSGRIRKVDELFHVYPLFFVYDVLTRLGELGYGPNLTRFEVDYFVIFARAHEDVEKIVELIRHYRQYDERYELEKFLKMQARHDTRFYKVLQYSQYLGFNNEQIFIKPECVEELAAKVNQFNKLLENDTLILFTTERPDVYQKMLSSELDLLRYHRAQSS